MRILERLKKRYLQYLGRPDRIFLSRIQTTAAISKSATPIDANPMDTSHWKLWDERPAGTKCTLTLIDDADGWKLQIRSQGISQVSFSLDAITLTTLLPMLDTNGKQNDKWVTTTYQVPSLDSEASISKVSIGITTQEDLTKHSQRNQYLKKGSMRQCRRENG